MKTAAVAVIAAVAGVAIGAMWGMREVSQLRDQVAEKDKALTAMKSAVPATAPTAPVQPATPPKEVEDKQKAGKQAARQAGMDDKSRQQLIDQIHDRNEKLVEAGHNMRELQGRIDALTQEIAAEKKESERLQAENRGLQEQLDAMKRSVESLRTDVSTRESKTTQTDTVTQELKRQLDDSARRLSKLGQITTEMEELGQRRDVYMRQVLRRYREVTEQFRTLALRLDNPREGTGPTSNDVSRIMQTINAADEDMRQLQVLNTQASRLQKEMQALRR